MFRPINTLGRKRNFLVVSDQPAGGVFESVLVRFERDPFGR